MCLGNQHAPKVFSLSLSLSHTSCQEFCEIPAITHDPRSSRERCKAALTRRYFVALVLLMLIVFADTALAQTEWKNNYLPLAKEDQTNPSIARPSNASYTIVVWEDSRDSGSSRTDIYAQKIDNINGLPMWTPLDGVPVCRAAYSQRNPRATYDSLGHVLIVWEDARVDTTSSAVYVQCLMVNDGSVATNWPSDGFVVSDTAKAERPRIVGGKDGAFVAWIDWRNNTSQDPDQYDRDIFLQYITSASPGWPRGAGVSWVSCGVAVPRELPHDQKNVELARDRYWQFAADSLWRDGVVLVYEDKRNTSDALGTPTWNVYADRFDADGAHTWGDVRCGDYNEKQLLPQVVSFGEFHGNGDSTAVIAWQDVREDPNDPEKYDIYGQVLDKRRGTILSGHPQGIGICTAPQTQRYPELSAWERQEEPGLGVSYQSRVICVYEDLREYGSRGVDVYASVLNGTSGVLVNSAGTDGEEICTSTSDQTMPRVDNYPGDEDAYIVWRHGLPDHGGYAQADIWYQMMDLENLLFSQTGGVGKAVTEAKGEQTTPQVGGPVFVFADRRREPITSDSTRDWNIYAETPGDCVGPTDMGWRDMFADVRTAGDASAMRFTTDAEGNSYVVWEKSAGSDDGRDVYIQKLDVDGVPRWENSGIKLNTSTFASHPDVTISDSIGGAQAAWHQLSETGTDEIWYAKISPCGKFVFRGFTVDTGRSPLIAYAARTKFYPSTTPPYPAYIGVLKDRPGYTAFGLIAWDNGQFGQIHNYQYNNNLGDFRIAASLSGTVYAISWETTSTNAHIEVHWMDPNAPSLKHSEFITTQDVRGADIAADFGGGGTYRDGVAVFCADTGSGRIDLYGVRFASTTYTISGPHKLTSAAQFERPSRPCLVPDSAFNSDGYGGMLVAWDWEYEMNTTPKHKVQTNKLEYIATGGGTLQWSSPQIIDVSAPTNAMTYPSIARISNQTPALDTMSFIVWEGMTELCSPARSKEVVGNWVVYNNYGPILRRAQWQYEKQIGPGGGTYTQTRPLVRTSRDNSVNAYWIDSRGPHDLVLGTRAWPKDTVFIIWGKDVADEIPVAPGLPRIGAHYPQPLSLSAQGVSHVEVVTDRESSARLALYDNLGREVGIVFDGTLPTGRTVLPFDVSGLAPGMYHYVLQGSEHVATRGLVIIR